MGDKAIDQGIRELSAAWMRAELESILGIAPPHNCPEIRANTDSTPTGSVETQSHPGRPAQGQNVTPTEGAQTRGDNIGKAEKPRFYQMRREDTNPSAEVRRA